MGNFLTSLHKAYVFACAGVGKSCFLLRFSDNFYTTSCISTIGIDYKIRTIELDGKCAKLQVWDAAGAERFWKIMTAYYRGVLGILLVCDVTDKSSFTAMPTSKVRVLADEYGIKFSETSSKTYLNVELVFFSIAQDIKQRLLGNITDSRAED